MSDDTPLGRFPGERVYLPEHFNRADRRKLHYSGAVGGEHVGAPGVSRYARRHMDLLRVLPARGGELTRRQRRIRTRALDEFARKGLT